MQKYIVVVLLALSLSCTFGCTSKRQYLADVPYVPYNTNVAPIPNYQIPRNAPSSPSSQQPPPSAPSESTSRPSPVTFDGPSQEFRDHLRCALAAINAAVLEGEYKNAKEEKEFTLAAQWNYRQFFKIGRAFGMSDSALKNIWKTYTSKNFTISQLTNKVNGETYDHLDATYCYKKGYFHWDIND